MDTEPTSTTTSTPPPESTSPSPTTTAPEPIPTTPAEPPKPKSPEEIAAEAESLKERGNISFKSGSYNDAIRLYTQAIDLLPTSPAYLTNRAAAYMGLKQFRPALHDCQVASSLQSSDPQAKTLIRLARCQHSLGESTAALSTLRAVLELEPGNAQAIQLQGKVLELEAHLRNFEGARERKEWGLARLALDKCLQSIEGQGGEVPAEWRLWRIELDLARGNWDAANTAAKCVPYLFPSRCFVTLTRMRWVTAMLCECSLTHQTRSRCAVTFSSFPANYHKHCNTPSPHFASILDTSLLNGYGNA